jgi:biopolymer transport protein ExbB
MASRVSFSRTSQVTFLLACLLAGLLLTAAGPNWQAARAQDAAQAGGEDSARADEGGRRNLFIHIIVSAGPIFGPMILLISIALVALVVLLAMDLRMNVSIPPAFVQEFTDTLNKRKFKEAYEMCKEDGAFLAQVLYSGMGRLQYGLEDAREAMRNTVDSLKAGKEQLISYLGTIGTLGPLIGLVGTVFGMILAFMKLSDPNRPPSAPALAGDISHALVVTMLGVGLSLFAIFFHTFFRNRLIRVTMDVSNYADDLLTQMYHNSRKPAGAAAQASGVRGAGSEFGKDKADASLTSNP